jgi:hypothetical protein
MEVSSAVHKRRPERVSATIPVSLLLDGEDSKTEHDGWMVEISPRGARVRTSFVLLAGQMVGIAASGDSGQKTSYRVVWVERSSSGCLAGLALLETAQA